MKEFSNITSINPEDKNTYLNKVFLTFDTDWVSDRVFELTLDIIEENNIEASIFLTHQTRLIDRIKRNNKIDLGIHPNFNFLLQGDFRYGKNIREVIDYYMNIVPDAKIVRSHYVTQNSEIHSVFEEKGLHFESNTYVPHDSGIQLKPWFLLKNLIKVPYLWADDVHLYHQSEWSVHKILSRTDLVVMNFHPVHIFLNTNSLDYYLQIKKSIDLKDLDESYKNKKSYGVYNFLMDILKNKDD